MAKREPIDAYRLGHRALHLSRVAQIQWTDRVEQDFGPVVETSFDRWWARCAGLFQAQVDAESRAVVSEVMMAVDFEPLSGDGPSLVVRSRATQGQRREEAFAGLGGAAVPGGRRDDC